MVGQAGDLAWLAPGSPPTAIQAVLRPNGSCPPSVPTPRAHAPGGLSPTRGLRAGRPPSDSVLAKRLGPPDLWEQAHPHLPRSPLLSRRPPPATLTRNRPAHTWPWLRGRVQTPCALRGAPAPQSGSVRASAYKVPSWAQGLSQHPLCPCPCPRLGSASTGLHMTHTPGPWSGCAHVDPMLSFAGSPSSHTHTHSHSRWLPDQLL